MRVLSGIQPSGSPHLGNYLGAMRQHIEEQNRNECFYFLADLHSLTTIREAGKLRAHSLELAAAYLALGLDPQKTVFFKQSAVPEHSELAWILNCIAPMGTLERAHAWKDAKSKGRKEITVGLFSYPILMAADILLYKPLAIPVGKDQKQHVEIARDLAEKFNHLFGDTFPLPEPTITAATQTVIGSDGQKMSKSYGNTVDFLAEEKILKKQISEIKTDSLPLAAPKDPDTCTVFQLFRLLAPSADTLKLAERYRAGNFGYGEAKTALYESVLTYFAPARARFQEILQHPDHLEAVLKEGAIKARSVANTTLQEVKEKTGLL